jgi:hypothetical protein
MSSQDDNEIALPIEIKEAMQIFISFLTANFAFGNEIDDIDFKMIRESITDEFIDTGTVPVMIRNGTAISGNDFFNASCIMMTDMLYNATSGNMEQAQEVLKELGIAVVNS